MLQANTSYNIIAIKNVLAKKVKQIFTLLIFCSTLISATTNKFKSENKELTKFYVYVPPKEWGHKGFYISSIEVTNKQYKDFLNDLKAKGEVDKLKLAKVDTSNWLSIIRYNEPAAFEEDYFQHPAYSGYPVVNISKKGALLYCEWLTQKYNATAKIKVRFDLPTEEQWVQAAKGGDSTARYPWKGDSITYQKRGKWYKQDLANYRHKMNFPTTMTLPHNDFADITTPSFSYMPNAYGIYNMAGNVAELLADKDYTKGGSWYSTSDMISITSIEEYAAQAGNKPYIGFRPVMTVINQDN